MPKKSFAVGASSSEPVSFDLVGTDAKGNAIRPIEFRCKPELQGAVMTELFQLAHENQEAAGLELMSSLIKRSIVAEQVELFDQVIHSDEVFVKIETLAEIGTFLLEAYTGNPISAQSPSTPGSPPITPTSVADYLSQPEPTLRPSTPIVYATPPTQ